MAAPLLPIIADQISLTELLQGCAAPVLVLGAENFEANDPAMQLLQDQTWLPLLRQAVAVGQRPTSHITDPRAIPSPQLKELMIEWAVLPLPDSRLLLIGRDVTFEKNLTLALADSRARYKDLIELTSDAVWEVDHAGRFSFVSPHGLLGWRSEDILGKRPHELGLVATDALTTPFLTQKAVHEAELWLKDKAETLRCLSISALPRVDASGVWVGARGLTRDITEMRQQATAHAQNRTREQITHDIVRTLHDSMTAEDELNAACRALTLALSAEGTAFLRRQGGQWSLATQYGPELPPAATILAETVTTLGDTLALDSGQRSWIVARTQESSSVTGAIVIWQQSGQARWTTEDTRMVATIAEQLGTVWSDLDKHLHLKALAERDGLTGLYNQRSFKEQVDHRINQRHGTNMALLNIDLDNFKLINDTLGHQVGDDVLRRFAVALEQNIRPGDLVGRVGGDEFLIWLERVDEKIAQSVADRVVKSAADIAASLAPLAKPLGASIGIALYAEGEDFATLLERADTTMYKAKKSGKGRTEIAQ